MASWKYPEFLTMPPEGEFHGSRPLQTTDPSTTRKIYVLNGVEARATLDGQVFYVDHNRKSLSWTKHDGSGKPLTLPNGWEARATDDGRVYYLDHNDQSSSWIRPLPNGEKYALPEGWPSSETASEPADPLEDLEVEITRCRLNLWRNWQGFSDCLCKKYALQHQATELDERIADDLAQLRSVRISASTLGAYAWRLNCLASSFIERWQAWKSPKDYQRSSYLRRLSLAVCPLRYGHLRTITKLQMALSMLNRSAETTNFGMLDEACTQAEAALDMDGHDQSARPEQMHIVAYILRQRYLQLRNLDDLQRSIELSSRASELDADDTGPYGDYENLSFSLWLRYDNTKGRDDLERAIAVYIEGLQRHVYKAEAYGRRVTMLTALLRRRYELLSDTSDLKKAISFLGRAIFGLSITSPKLADLCSDAVSFLLSCSEVDSKITYFQEAMKFAHIGLQQKYMNVDRAFQLLVGVGKVWLQRFTKTSDLSDQRNALRFFEEALSISGNNGPSRTTAWHFISLTYENTYISTNNQEYLQLALQSSTRGLETASDEDTWYMYARAARSRAMKYQRNNEDLAALSEAIAFSEKALQAVKECDLHDRAKAWHRAGQVYYLKFKRSRDAEDFTAALTYLLSCWHTKGASFVERIASVKLAGALLTSVGRWRCAWEHLSDAVQFVSTNFPPHLNRMETQELAKALSGLASEACAAGLAIGETTAALEHLEQGRGLLISSTYGASGEIGNLQVDHPPLYDAFMKLRKLALEESKLDPNVTLLPGGFLESEKQRGVAFEYLKKGVQTIRKQHGYERFLMPLRASDMQKLAGDGAIVVINNTHSRDDAILVTRHEIKALRLPDLPEVPVWNTKLEVISGPIMDKLAHETLNDATLSKKSQNGMLALILNIYGNWLSVLY